MTPSAVETCRILVADDQAGVLETGPADFDPFAAAQRVQKRLLPPGRFRSPIMEWSFVSYPATVISGDYCDLLCLDDDHAAFALADICGKGFAAGLLMASVHAAVRSHAELLNRPAELASLVNRLLCDIAPEEQYATMFVGYYERSTRSLRYVNCGHPPALLWSGEGGITRLGATATACGLFKDARFSEETLKVAPRSRLLLFSDGLTDSDPNGDDEWIVRSVCMLAAANSPSIVESLGEAALNGEGEIDDVTIAEIRFL